MILLECFIVLICVLCCNSAPASDTEIPEGHCGHPPRLEFKELSGSWSKPSYPGGTQASYTCSPGYVRQGPTTLVCTNGKWENLKNTACKKRPCGHPGDVEFGSFELIKDEQFVFGAVVKYTCDDGYKMVSKANTRTCTATGWSNNPPICEVKQCGPIVADVNVNILYTSEDDEHTVGQVVRFECKTADQTLKGPSEIYCTSEGEWSEQPPKCTETVCTPPVIIHGKPKANSAQTFKSKQTLYYECDNGYKPSRTPQTTCTSDGWSPAPMCEEIFCTPEHVKYGNIRDRKDIYRNGDEVILECRSGYTPKGNPNEPRKCTTNGWVPSLECVSKQCTKPEIQNGQILTGATYRRYYGWPRFPMTEGNYFYYSCVKGYSPPNRDYDDYSYCTREGWDPQPKCSKQCSRPSSEEMNAYIDHTQSVYFEGDRINFYCNHGYKTQDGRDSGVIECLFDGKFTKEKCLNFCLKPNLKNGSINTTKTQFEDGNIVMYTCDEGYYSENKKFQETSSCDKSKWEPQPKCEAITCRLEYRNNGGRDYKSGDVVQFKCQAGELLNGNSTSQCYHFGWYPELPVCTGGYKDLNPLIKDGVTECPPAPVPPNSEINYVNDNEVEIVCNQNYILSGRDRVSCNDGKWQSPPMCIQLQRCGQPPSIENGVYVGKRESKYISGSTVKYKCNEGYRMANSDENVCTNGQWARTPTCEEKPCGKPKDIENGEVTNVKPEYKSSERVTFKCSEGYTLSRTFATCLKGTWFGIPECIDSRCENPPTIANGKPKEPGKTTGKKYLPESRVEYQCNRGYAMKDVTHVICKNSQWINTPECRKTGESCGIPPAVNYGDIEGRRKDTYPSGSSVKYTCMQWHTIDGKAQISCKDGEWEKPPSCREPCTIRELDMKMNNIEFEHRNFEKIYSVHGDSMTFRCINGYEIPSGKPLRVQCLDAKVNYPKCFKKGFCELDQSTIKINNLYYNESDIVENGNIITFECTEGMIPEGSLDATCREKQITYPKCISSHFCSMPKLENGLLHTTKTHFEDGNIVMYTCDEGYYSENKTFQETSYCDKSRWKPQPKCEAITCRLGTRIRVDFYNSGDVVHFKCQAGEVLNGDSTSQCYYFGWYPELPVCSVRSRNLRPLIKDDATESKCPPAPVPPNSALNYLNDNEVEIVCNQHYILSGRDRISCNNGKWQSPPMCIQVQTCSQPPSIENGQYVQTSISQYFSGSTVKYRCNEGYRMTSSDENVCTNGQWARTPTCEEKPCGKPEDIENGKVTNVKPEYQPGERVTFQCYEGYTLSRTSATCFEGTWVGIPECIDSTCGNPPTIANGKPKNPGDRDTTGKKYLPESKVEYQCNPEYSMKDVNHVICKNSQWINEPKCRKTGESCGIPPVVNYGEIDGRRQLTYTSGSSVQYTCIQWHILDGKAHISCKDGEWEMPPLCREPCTVRESDMKINNIEFVYRRTEKIYSQHGDSFTFRCVSGYEIPVGKPLRIQCLDGKVNYPKCFKKGFCELDQSMIKRNNLYYEESDIVENSHTITFECTEGMIPEGSLDATCREKQITYPKCITS